MSARVPRVRILLAPLAFSSALLAPDRSWAQLTSAGGSEAALRYEAQLQYRMEVEVKRVFRASGLEGKPAFAAGIAPVGPGADPRVAASGDQPFRDPRGTEVSETTVFGLTLVRDMYILQAEWMASFFDAIREGGVQDKRERIQAARRKAAELVELYEAALKATEARDAYLRSTRGEDFMSPDEKEQSVQKTLEHTRAHDEAWKAFNDAADEAGRTFPELLIETTRPDGEKIPLWSALGRFPREGVEADMDDILTYNRYLEQGAADLRKRAEAARGHDTLDELWQYLRPEFQGLRDAVRGQGKAAESDLPSKFMDELEAVGRAFDIQTAVDEGWTKVILASVGAIAILINPALCLAVSVIDVTMEGNQLVVAFRTANEAQQAAPILGFRHVITAEERARAAEGEFVLAAIGVGLDAAAMANMKIVGAGDCPQDLARTGDAADAGRVADAAGAGRMADAAPKRWGHLGDATVDEAFGHPNIPDDAWVHFGGSEIADGIRQDGVLGRSYWARWGEVKNWTQGELRFNIGSMSKSGLSDLKTMVVAPDNAPIRLKRGEYGFEVEGVTDETIQGGRVIVAEDGPVAGAGRAGAVDAGRPGAPGAPGAPRDPPGPPRANDVARGAPEPGGLRPDDVDFWRRNEADRIKRDRGYGIERADETDAKLERFEESIQAATDAGIPRGEIDEALDAVRRKQVSIPSEGQTGLDVAIKDFRIRMVIKEAIRKDITIVLRETDRVHLDALGGGNAKVIVLEPADANLVIAKAAMDRGQGAGTWTAAEADLARRLQRENPEKLYVFDPEQFEGGLYPLMDADDAANLNRIFGDARPPGHETRRLTREEVEAEAWDAETVHLRGDANAAEAPPPGPASGNPPGEVRAPTAGEPADRPPAGAGNVPRAAGAGNVPAPDDREPPQDALVPPAGRPDEVGAAPGPVGAEDGPQVASVGTTFQHTISPIDFYMGPVLDLSDQTYAAINFPVTLATGRDVRIQIVILSAPSGAAGGTRERRPSDPRPDRPGTRTSWRGSADVPGGGILLFAADPKVLVRSLGSLGGGAMEMQVFGADPGQERISAEGLVVEPIELNAALRQQLDREIQALAGQPITATLDAYCLDFLRLAPNQGAVFRIADRELQERFAPLRDVLKAGRRQHDAGLLNPDSDPEEYFHSIRQWALWSAQEGLDLGGFEEAFLEHTQKNFETAGQPWTEQMQELVKSLVPNRWQDISRILDEARVPE